MIGKQGLEEHKKNYNRVLNEWCKNRGYSYPWLYGWVQEKIKKQNNIYKLKLDKHNSVCLKYLIILFIRLINIY